MNIMQFIPMIAIVVIGSAYLFVMKRTHYAGGNLFDINDKTISAEYIDILEQKCYRGKIFRKGTF